jgi:hypothetical protein
MKAITPLPGPGRFQWNTGGWFGSQAGGTSWMLVGAASVFTQAPRIAAVFLACFLLANGIGTWMWCRRDCLRPYLALQLLLLVVGVSGLLALGSLDALAPRGVRMNLPRSEMVLGYRTLLIVVPALMAGFALQEWLGKPRPPDVVLDATNRLSGNGE